MIIESKGKIADSLFALGTPGLPSFLLAGQTPVMFDAGMTYMGPTYLNDLNLVLGDARKLRFVFLTHAHFDHSGSCPYLKKRIAGLQAGAHVLAAATFQKPNAVALIRSLSRDYEERYAANEDVAFDSLDIEIPLQDEADFDLGDGLGFRVISTPGHTRDAVSFYIPQLKALITGEAAGVFDANMTIHPEFLASYDDYLASLKKLSSLDIDILMLGHNFTLTGPDAGSYVKKSLARTQEFKRRIELYLHDAQGNQDAVVKRIFKEDFEDTGAILQEARPFLINLTAKVKAVAGGK